MYLASLHNGHSELIVLGMDQDHALELLQAAWQRESDEPWEWVEYAVFSTFIRQGDILRDGELIHSYDTAARWLTKAAVA